MKGGGKVGPYERAATGTPNRGRVAVSLAYLRGGFSMMSGSALLNPSAVAGGPSVTRLTHSSWTGIRF